LRPRFVPPPQERLVSSIWPAILSAVAATFSATAAWLVLQIQRTNLRVSVQPRLKLSDWGFGLEQGMWCVTVRSVKNVGKGPALRVVALGTMRSRSAGKIEDGWVHNSHGLHALMPEESAPIVWRAWILWGKRNPLFPHLRGGHAKFRIEYSDSMGNVYQDMLRVTTMHDSSGPLDMSMLSNSLAPGLDVAEYHTEVISRQRLFRSRIRRRLQRHKRAVSHWLRETVPHRVSEEVSFMRRRFAAERVVEQGAKEE
jgi:hypothetical protein